MTGLRAFRGGLAGGLLLVVGHAAAAEWRHVSTQLGTAGLAGDEVQFLKPAVGGGVWIGTLTGLSKAGDGVFQRVPGPDGKPLGLAVWDLLEQPDGTVLVGHEHGVLPLGGAAAKPLQGGTAAPLLTFGDQVWTLLKKGGVGTAMARGADGAWSAVAALKGVRAEDMVRLPDGSVWVVADGDGVHEVVPGGAASAPKHHLRGLNVTSVLQDRRGRVWCTLWGGGVMMREGEAWTQHLAREKAALLGGGETPDGAVWFGSSASGLWRFDGRNWQHLLEGEGPVSLLGVTSDGRVWVSAQQTGGLRFWDGRTWQTALPGPLPVRCLLEAPDGSLWVGGVLDGVHVYK